MRRPWARALDVARCRDREARAARRERSRTAAFAALLVGLVIAASSSPTRAQEATTHGALAMDQQIARLEALGITTTATGAPAGVTGVIWQASIPADNAMTPERIALGRKLYFDPRLSADGTVACATCHDVSRGFTDQRPVSEGIDGKLGRRNAPTTLNAMLLTSQFWDGRAADLEAQAKLPIVNPVEMGMPDGAAVVKVVAADPEYVAMFQTAYGREPSYDDIGRAIAAFERTLVFLDAPFDRFVAGDVSALSAEAQRGMALYNGKARCVTCHPLNPANPIGSDGRFHNIGVSARHQDFSSLAKQALAALEADSSAAQLDRLALQTDMSELGRFMVTKRRDDIGGFKTSQVRNLTVSAPYMHDGSMQTLWDVMDHYNRGGEANLFLDGGIEPLALTDTEIDEVVAFLVALTDTRFAKETETAMAAQRTLAATKRPFKDEALAMRRVLPFESKSAAAGQEVRP